MSQIEEDINHEIANSIGTVLLAINTVESKILEGDIDGALYTISLMKAKKIKINTILAKVKEIISRDKVQTT